MPLIRRIPKRGFTNAEFKTHYAPINLDTLSLFDEGTRVDEKILREKGVANGKADGIKILGRGTLTKKLIVCAHAFSASARTAIEAAGGACEVVTKVKKTEPKA